MALKRQEILLTILAGLAIAAGYVYWPGDSRVAGATPIQRGTTRPGQASTAQEVPDVHLDALNDGRPELDSLNRNLFRFKPKPVPPPPPPRPVIIAPDPVMPTGPPPPPPLPPINLKFIGLLQRSPTERIAILSDGRGPIYGKEGEAVLGQYKIVRIGTESIDLTYLDGRGRQTIRLSGS